MTDKKVDFGILQKGQSFIDILEIYQSPTTSDYFRMKKCTAKFKDIHSQQLQDAPISLDFSKTARVTVIHPEAVLIFSLKS